jgi:flagellar L-ring protein precursor FlgH
MQFKSFYRSRRTARIIGFTLYAILASAWLARSGADSIYPVQKAKPLINGSSSAGAASLYSDVRARDVGELITIIISENTTASSSATTETSKSESFNALNTSGLLRRFFRDINLGANSSNQGKGNGVTTRSGTLETTLMVKVKEVLPNGTLKIEGSRLIQINKETQRVTLTGLVRPEDVSFNNTIPSTLVADIEVKYDGKGVVSDQQRPGLLSRIFRFLF